MEVLRNNFEAILPNIKHAIDEADFIAIDTELSGIGAAQEYRIDTLDTVQERYEKIKRSATRFMIVQFGLCTFAWDNQEKNYVAKAFNCYVFPQTGSRPLGLDRDFHCQAAAIEFLMGNNFDFNKWVSQGIPYVNLDEEARARHNIGAVTNGTDIELEGENKEYVEKAMQVIHGWLQYSSEKSIKVESPTSFHRRLIHQEVKKKYNTALKTEGNSGYVLVTKLTEEQRRTYSDDRVSPLLGELDQLIGFRRVIELISKAKKPVIGHNMMLDTLQIFSQFHKALPDDVQDFKQQLKELFPIVYDTKYIAESDASIQPLVAKSVLSDILRSTSYPPFKNPRIAPHRDFGGYNSDDSFHEAGYDAYATGIVFAKMIGYGAELQQCQRISFTAQMLQETRNKLFLMKSDMPYLDIDAREETPNRSHVFHMYGYPSETTLRDIQREFKDLGNIGVTFLSPRSCLLTIRDLEKVAEVLQTYGSERSNKREKAFDYHLEDYEDYLSRKRAPNDNGPVRAGPSNSSSNSSNFLTSSSSSPSESENEVQSPKRKRDQMDSDTGEAGPPIKKQSRQLKRQIRRREHKATRGHVAGKNRGSSCIIS